MLKWESVTNVLIYRTENQLVSKVGNTTRDLQPTDLTLNLTLNLTLMKKEKQAN